MNIKMIGIDYSKASVEIREKFSFTKKNSILAMNYFKENCNLSGCIVISTCNRTEIWASFEDEQFSLFKSLCDFKNLDFNLYNGIFTERNGMEAVNHLFRLTCGLKSKILGEDQIITQVKDALSLSRENNNTDNVMEVLFRLAITSAKKVKTHIKFSKGNISVVDAAVEKLKENKIYLKNKNCLVIGNGEMGKLACQRLLEEKACVTVTLRQYKSGEVNIPIGCNIINYSERLNNINDFDIVVSATLSPNCTIKYDEIKDINIYKNMIFIDLAVPRDIDSKIKNLENVLLYDIDNFGVDIIDEASKTNIKKAKNIIKDYILEFEDWYKCKDLLVKVNEIGENAACDINFKINRYMKDLNINSEDKKIIQTAVEKAANKVVGKIMFGLKDTLDTDIWCKCIKGIEKSYLKIKD